MILLSSKFPNLRKDKEIERSGKEQVKVLCNPLDWVIGVCWLSFQTFNRTTHKFSVECFGHEGIEELDDFFG